MRIIEATPLFHIRDATIRHLASAAGELQRQIAGLQAECKRLENRVHELEKALGMSLSKRIPVTKRGPYQKHVRTMAAKAGV